MSYDRCPRHRSRCLHNEMKTNTTTTQIRFDDGLGYEEYKRKWSQLAPDGRITCHARARREGTGDSARVVAGAVSGCRLSLIPD